MNSSTLNKEKPPIGHVTYYQEHGISPVRQDISDLNRHYQRRSALYKDLGIPLNYIMGKKVIEFGPGSGYNAIHVAQFNPQRYVLVEPNPEGRRQIVSLFSKYCVDKKYQIIDSLIEDYIPDDKFDLVIGEGFLGTAPNATELTQTMGSMTSPSGVLVITTCDAVSALSDLLKRSVGRAVLDHDVDLSTQTKQLVPIYKPLLGEINGMSRSPEDWILDCVIQPFYSFDFFSIEAAIQALKDTHIFYSSSSPRFSTEFRWYKQQWGKCRFNDLAIESYKRNIHNLIDFRWHQNENDSAENAGLLIQAKKVIDVVSKYDDHTADRQQLNSSLLEETEALTRLLKELQIPPMTIEALEGFLAGFEQLVFSKAPVPDFGSFTKWSGRGQQYCSFLRKNPPFMG